MKKIALIIFAMITSLAGCAIVPVDYSYSGDRYSYYRGDRYYPADRYNRGYYRGDGYYYRGERYYRSYGYQDHGQ